MANREHKTYPNSERHRSTRREDGLRRLLEWKINPPSPVMSTVLPMDLIPIANGDRAVLRNQ